MIAGLVLSYCAWIDRMIEMVVYVLTKVLYLPLLNPKNHMALAFSCLQKAICGNTADIPWMKPLQKQKFNFTGNRSTVQTFELVATSYMLIIVYLRPHASNTADIPVQDLHGRESRPFHFLHLEEFWPWLKPEAMAEELSALTTSNPVAGLASHRTRIVSLNRFLRQTGLQRTKHVQMSLQQTDLRRRSNVRISAHFPISPCLKVLALKDAPWLCNCEGCVRVFPNLVHVMHVSTSSALQKLGGKSRLQCGWIPLCGTRLSLTARYLELFLAALTVAELYYGPKNSLVNISEEVTSWNEKCVHGNESKVILTWISAASAEGDKLLAFVNFREIWCQPRYLEPLLSWTTVFINLQAAV